MGRLKDESQNHQEIHQNPTFDTSEGVPPPPPPPEEDLYEPPADYQPPPPPPATKDKSTPQVVHSFPPPQGNDDDDYEKPPPQPFPPTQSQAFFPPSSSTPQAFPPTQSQAFEPPPKQQNVHFHPNQVNQTPQNHQNFIGQPGIPMIAPSPFMVQQNQPWKTHLFDCMKNPQNAIITLFFPCVTFGQIAEVVDNGSTSCGTSGIVYSLIACCIGMPCLMSCGYRSKLRAKFGLVEAPAPDCLIHCFCEYCALCQEYRELEQRGFDPSIGHAGNMAKQQRQKQFGMASPMQQRMMM